MPWWPLLALLAAGIPLVEDGEDRVLLLRWAIPREYSRRPHLAQPIRIVGHLTRTAAEVTLADSSDVNAGWDCEPDEVDPWLEAAAPTTFPPAGWRALLTR